MQRLRTQMRWIMIIIVLAFLLSTFLMYESPSRNRGGTSSDGRMQDYAVAEINGRNLMRSALNEQVELQLRNMGTRELASIDLPLLYESALRQYIMEQQIVQEVRDKGIKVSDEEAEVAMKQYADQAFPTREAFYESLERAGMKQAEFKKEIAANIARQRLIESSIGTTTISEDEAVKFYDTIKDFYFKQPAGIKIDMANFSVKGGADKVRELLVAGKAWEVATSDDVVSQKELLGKTRGEPIFIPASFLEDRYPLLKDLKIGEVSPVFEATSDDWVVAVKREVVEENVKTYAVVSGDVHALLKQSKEREAIALFSQGLVERAKVVILDTSIFPSEKAAEDLPVTPEGKTEQQPASVSGDVAVSGDKKE